MRYSAALLLALAASERREVVVVDMGDATLSLPRRMLAESGNAMGKSYRPPTVIIDDPPCLQERADEAAAKLEAAMAELPNFYAPVKGRILEQAKGPNRAADRARGIYKRGKR